VRNDRTIAEYTLRYAGLAVKTAQPAKRFKRNSKRRRRKGVRSKCGSLMSFTGLEGLWKLAEPYWKMQSQRPTIKRTTRIVS
jgi:hypothetical protein